MSQIHEPRTIERKTLPVVSLRQLVIFPGTPVPIAAGRAQTLRAIEAAIATPSKEVFAVLQRDDSPEIDPGNLHTIGTIARIDQLQRGLGGTQVLITGVKRGIALRIDETGGYLQAVVNEAEELYPNDLSDLAFVALHREVRTRAGELGEKSGLPREVAQKVLSSVDDPGRLADLIAAHLDLPPEQRQGLLEMLSVEERLRKVLTLVQRQIGVLDAQEHIKSQVQEELGDRQREMFLREQLKAIQKELGEDDEGDELGNLRGKLEALSLPEGLFKEVDRELRRLERMGREALEAQVIRTFLETILELPWSSRSEDQLDLTSAKQILEEDHYGLNEVKDRILEFLAVHQMRARSLTIEAPAEPTSNEESTASVPGESVVAAKPEDSAPAAQGAADSGESETASDENVGPEARESTPIESVTTRDAPPESRKNPRKSPILLFAGPPGVGKTSLARSIARAMGREYVRISLGGVRDEADIRGHRRTYVGAMPGRIIQGMKQAGTKNPVFLLDEVDKLGASFQGDPGSALLEVLDPAQNNTFTDHYLGLPFDLSEVFFIATANFLTQIPEPLRDRMEVVHFSGYTEREKLEIAKRFLLPHQVEDAGLRAEEVQFTDDALAEVIQKYTREAGVRQLEREIGRLGRKAARQIASRSREETEQDPQVVSIDKVTVNGWLGRPKVHPEHMAEKDQVGVATGLYYTPMGGDIMFVETSTMKGKGKLTLTGQLGEVMQESAQAAWTYARSHAKGLRIDNGRFESLDVHIHVPAGAIPKDGPSAGITMATALISALSSRPVRHDLAMTGEVTLTGKVLPIGGVKEKVLGAVRAGIREILLPRDNEADLEDLPDDVRASLTVHLASELGEVLAVALRDASFQGGRLLFTGDDPKQVRLLSETYH